MWKFLKKNYLLISLIIIQSIIYIITGLNKEYIHIDEAYSFGLANYEMVEIQDKEDFYDNWHTKEYYERYLSVQEDSIGKYGQVYENQKNDVHPPFFYLLLRFAMFFTRGHFSKWSGIVLNIIIYCFVTVFMYLILYKLFRDEKNAKEKSIILAFISSIILASISNVVYIRMYSLLTLEILITIFLHMELIESKETDIKLLIGIGITILAGVLTHYYYLLYLAALYIIILVRYIKSKEAKSAVYYTLTMIIAGVMSLVIFPYSINHMFFGDRGQGVISNMKNVTEIAQSILSSIKVLDYYAFNGLLYIIIAVIVLLTVYRIYRKKQINISKEKRGYLRIIYIPAIFFFIVASIASPWKVLRYIVPVCGLIFVITIYYLYKLLDTIFKEKTAKILICVLFCIILISPFIFDMEPELLYRDRKEIVSELGGELNVPTVYLYKPGKGSFLDDILLFSIIDESYIAKNIDYTEENIRQIYKDKDTSRGIVVFINEGEENSNILQTVSSAVKKDTVKHLKKLTSCDVYYIK